MSSWKRKQGICLKCHQPFRESISLQSEAEWDNWATDINQMSPLQRWWTENIHLCSDCELSFEAHEYIANLEPVTFDYVGPGSLDEQM